MFLLFFGAVMAIVGVMAGVYLGSRMIEREGGTPRKPQNKASAQQAEPAPTQPAERRRFWFAPSQQPDQALQFQNWASTRLQNAELREWIAALSKEQVHALAEQLSAFCDNLGFNLEWLTSQRLVSNPKLEPTAVVIVEHYCTACLQATSAQSDFQLFKKALEMLDQPFTREHKLITQRLYADLVRRNIAQPMSPDLMVANEQARQEQISRVLKDVSTTNWVTFMLAFEDAARADEAAKPKTSWNSTLRNPFRPREAAASAEQPAVNLNAQATSNEQGA
ncbi:MAG: hypothetical protein HGA65_08710 [Oscillochloris sp.]|nr:hypothetical protein [Oscillochloris sp.]